MRKALACVMLGIVVGVVLGVGLVILQMKYGSAPVVGDVAVAPSEAASCIDEPKPVEIPEEAASEPTSTEAGAEHVHPASEPVGVETEPVLARPAKIKPAREESAERLVELEQRLREHLLQHAVAQAAASKADAGSEEPTCAPTAPPLPTAPPSAAPPSATYATVPEPAPVAQPMAPPPAYAPEPVPMPAPPIRQPAMLAVPDPWAGTNWVPPPMAPMLPFTGAHPATLTTPKDGRDPKAVILSAGVQTQLGRPRACVLFAAPGPEHTIWLYPPEGIAHLAEKFEHQLGNDEDARRCWRMCFSRISRIEVRDGRFMLAPELVDYAGLHQDLMVIGVGDHFEVWDADAWQEYNDDAGDEPDGIAVKKLVRKTPPPHVQETDQAATEVLIRVLGLLRDAGDLSRLTREWECLWPSGASDDNRAVTAEDD